MTTFRWLHITDLHQGEAAQAAIQPFIEQKLFDDLEKMLRGRPIDAVLFTGDLTFSGRPAEFVELNKTLDRLWSTLRRLGSDPCLLAVPGNHDLIRPAPGEPAITVLRNWKRETTDPVGRWLLTPTPYRSAVDPAFAPYMRWWETHPFPRAHSFTPGLLPGDFSAVLKKAGATLGIVGLNTAYLQLAGGDFLEKLAVGREQFHAACGGNGPAWVRQRDASLLLTHHPPDWLDPEVRDQIFSDIAAPGNFAVHLFGHMHKGKSRTLQVGGGDAVRTWQGDALFGLEHWGEPDAKVERCHGYAIGEIAFAGDGGKLRLWPRDATKPDGGVYRFVPDHASFELEDDNGTRAEPIRRNRVADDPADTAVIEIVRPQEQSSEGLSKVTSDSLPMGGTFVQSRLTIPIWRRPPENSTQRPASHKLRFSAPEGSSFVPGDDLAPAVRTITVEPGAADVLIGRAGTAILSLGDTRISRRALVASAREGRLFLRLHADCTNDVWVGASKLTGREERALCHGQPVYVFPVTGVFLDGRYAFYPVPAQTVDDRTGLLARDGLAWEIGAAALAHLTDRLLLARVLGGAPSEEDAVRVALALYAERPAWPVARFGIHVGALVPAADDLTELFERLTAITGLSLLGGPLPLPGSHAGANICLEEALGALAIAASVAQTGCVDLAAHRLPVRNRDTFLLDARAIVDAGGEVALLAMEEVDRLKELGPSISGLLELELLQLVGRLAGPGSVVTQIVPGVVGFASPMPAAPLARSVAFEWRVKGPIRSENDWLEVERGLSTEVLAAAALGEIETRAVELAENLGIEGLPSPIAAKARAAFRAASDAERLAGLVDVVMASWRLLAVVLRSIAVATQDLTDDTRTSRPIVQVPEGWPEPWSTLAVYLAKPLARLPGRVGELCAAIFAPDGRPQKQLDVATRAAVAMKQRLAREGAEAIPIDEVHRLEEAVVALLGALRPLRGWTLVSVLRAERQNEFLETVDVDYVDHTGTSEHGVRRDVRLVKAYGIREYVYLTRIREGVMVLLEPLLRFRVNPVTRTEELFWAEGIISTAGKHRYGSVFHGDIIEDEVTSKSLRPKVRR